jgi:hypothetical protein
MRATSLLYKFNSLEVMSRSSASDRSSIASQRAIRLDLSNFGFSVVTGVSLFLCSVGTETGEGYLNPESTHRNSPRYKWLRLQMHNLRVKGSGCFGARPANGSSRPSMLTSLHNH